MISNLIVFSTLFLGVLFTVLTIIRPEFRARVEQPKFAFLEQLSMYDRSVGAEQHGGESENTSEQNSENDSKTKSAVRSK